MSQQGNWLGQWAGQWFGSLEDLPPGFISAYAAFTIAGEANLTGRGELQGGASLSVSSIGTLTAASSAADIRASWFAFNPVSASIFLSWAQFQPMAADVRMSWAAFSAVYVKPIWDDVGGGHERATKLDIDDFDWPQLEAKRSRDDKDIAEMTQIMVLCGVLRSTTNPCLRVVF